MTAIASIDIGPPTIREHPDGRKSMHIGGIVQTLSPLVHGGSVRGTVLTFRREKIRQEDGSYLDVPVYSGNAIRGQLRDAGMQYMLDRLGFGEGSLSPSAFYFLFSGGALSKEAGIGLDIDRARRLRKDVPLIGVLGGAVGRQVLRGKLRMGRLVPICIETREVLPFPLREQARTSIFDALDIVEYTRTDDAKNELLSDYLGDEVRAQIEGPKVSTTADGSEIATGGAQQMRYGAEAISAGMTFWHQWELIEGTPLEWQALASAWQRFGESPHLGGGARIGHGLVATHYRDLFSTEPRRLLIDAAAPVVLNPEEDYDAHLMAHREEIGDLLQSIP